MHYKPILSLRILGNAKLSDYATTLRNAPYLKASARSNEPSFGKLGSFLAIIGIIRFTSQGGGFRAAKTLVAERSVRRRNFVASARIRCARTYAGATGRARPVPRLQFHQAIDEKINGYLVFVEWGWGGYGAFLDLCEIQVDRGDGKGFGLLAFESTPGYTDTTPFPAAPVKWTYRSIYRVDDAQVSVWSNPVSVTVTG